MRLLLAILISHATVNVVHAGVTFLGPTPYLSKADSPFPVDGSNPNFYLEDFEDGELNTLGISQRDIYPPELGGIYLGRVVEPSTDTDSVDADDKGLDGLGNLAYSFRSGIHFTTFTDPPGQQFQIILDFDSAQLGYFPNRFGFVWTDGRHNSSLSLTLTTASGAMIDSTIVASLGDQSREGETAEDRFIGIGSSEGISSVTIFGGYVGESNGFDFFEIDHVQYGLVVAEPTSFLPLWGFVLAGAIWKRRFRLVSKTLLLIIGLQGNSAIAAPGDLLFKLTAPDPQPGSGFGDVINIVDGHVLVGEPGRFHPNTGVGRAYLFDGTTGELKLSLNNPELMNQDAFGGALAGGDGRIFISTEGLIERIYTFSTTTGELLNTIYDPDGSSNDFGTNVAYGGGDLLISSAYPRTVELLGAGRGYFFKAATGQLKGTVPNWTAPL